MVEKNLCPFTTLNGALRKMKSVKKRFVIQPFKDFPTEEKKIRGGLQMQKIVLLPHPDKPAFILAWNSLRIKTSSKLVVIGPGAGDRAYLVRSGLVCMCCLHGANAEEEDIKAIHSALLDAVNTKLGNVHIPLIVRKATASRLDCKRFDEYENIWI
jgi:hypothetical protein